MGYSNGHKWTPEDVEKLRKLALAGKSGREIAIEMDMRNTQISSKLKHEGIHLSPKEDRRLDIGMPDQTKDEEILADAVAKTISAKKKDLRELADQFDVSPKRIILAIEQLESKNILVDNFSDGGFMLAKSVAPVDRAKVIDLSKHKEIEYPLGFITDTHIGSNYERLDVLNALYDRFEQYGIETVYHGGNWIDGEFRFNRYDIYVHGIEAQIRNFVRKYPQRKGIETHIISGDDHEGWYVKREHIDIGKTLIDRAKEAEREDLFNLGYIERDIEFKQKGGMSSIRIIHAGGGSSYAVSYSSQKYAESLQGGEKPSIVLVGHFHKFDWSYPREVHVIQGGCTCDQTPWMRKRRIQAMVGGCVLWIKQNDRGIFTSVKVEWLPFYDKKFYTYKWMKQ